MRLDPSIGWKVATLVIVCTGLAGCQPDQTAPDRSADDSNAPAELDQDGDGFTEADDCDDTDATVSPSAAERCDGIDNNCDGVVDPATSVDAPT